MSGSTAGGDRGQLVVNRLADFQGAKADHDFVEQELELKTSAGLTRAIHVLTTELHRRIINDPVRRSS